MANLRHGRRDRKAFQCALLLRIHLVEMFDSDQFTVLPTMPGSRVQLSPECLVTLRFVHGHTEIFSIADAPTMSIVGASQRGSTTWVATRPAQPSVCLAWPWVQLQSGVIMLVHPLQLRSNIDIADSDGRLMGRIETMLQLNRIVGALDWHRVVERAARSAPMGP